MKKTKLPKTDSIQKLAEFWDKHDVTDFERELAEIDEPVFVRGAGTRAMKVPLAAPEVAAVERMARAKGVSGEQLVRGWVLEKLGRRRNGSRAKR